MKRESALYEKSMHLKDTDFKQIIGVKKETYEKMLSVLEIGYAEKHKRRGRHAKLALSDILFMALKYWRQYITQKELAFEFGVGEATVHDWINWTENVLIKSGEFSLPGKKALLGDNEIEIILVDVTESPVERPKKNKELGIPGKRSDIHKKHNC